MKNLLHQASIPRQMTGIPLERMEEEQKGFTVAELLSFSKIAKVPMPSGHSTLCFNKGRLRQSLMTLHKREEVTFRLTHNPKRVCGLGSKVNEWMTV